MKRILSLILLALSCLTPLFCEAQDDANLKLVSTLIDDGLFTNRRAIAQASKALTPQQRLDLYIDNRKSPTVGFAVNAVVGFGVGSFMQGDLVGGFIAAPLDALGVTSLLIVNRIVEDSDGYWADGSVIASICGGTVLIASRLFQIIRPFAFVSKYNRTLSSSLNTNSISMNLVPLVSPDGRTSITCLATLKF